MPGSRTPRTTDRHDATLAPSADASAVGDAMTAYLRDVRAQAERYPLLSQEEERALIARIRAGMFRPGCGIYGPPTPDALAAYEHFVGANLRLVVARAATQARTAQTLTLPDLVQAGNLGMLTALWKFDPNRGHKFSTYATAWIRQAIQRERQTHDRLIALPVHVQERRHPQARRWMWSARAWVSRANGCGRWRQRRSASCERCCGWTRRRARSASMRRRSCGCVPSDAARRRPRHTSAHRRKRPTLARPRGQRTARPARRASRGSGNGRGQHNGRIRRQQADWRCRCASRTRHRRDGTGVCALASGRAALAAAR